MCNLEHAEHLLEKPEPFYTFTRKVNLKLLANPSYPTEPETFGQKLRKKRMDLGLQLKELAQFFGVTEDTVINWELRGRRSRGKNSKKVEDFLQGFKC